MALAGDVNRTETRGPWKLTFSASGAIPALSVGPGDSHASLPIMRSQTAPRNS